MCACVCVARVRARVCGAELVRLSRCAYRLAGVCLFVCVCLRVFVLENDCSPAHELQSEPYVWPNVQGNDLHLDPCVRK